MSCLVWYMPEKRLFCCFFPFLVFFPIVSLIFRSVLSVCSFDSSLLLSLSLSSCRRRSHFDSKGFNEKKRKWNGKKWNGKMWRQSLVLFSADLRSYQKNKTEIPQEWNRINRDRYTKANEKNNTHTPK